MRGDAVNDRHNALLELASAAQQGILANPDPQQVTLSSEKVASWACDMAEALLAEAAKRWGIEFDDEEKTDAK